MTEKQKRERARAANRKYYLTHTEAEKKRTTEWRKNNLAWCKWYYKKNKKKIAANTRKSAYGITQVEYERKLKKQKGLCAVCSWKMSRPDVDHNHDTGAVRDLLCRNCNTAIGLVHESGEVLLSMIEYLKRHKESNDYASRRKN